VPLLEVILNGFGQQLLPVINTGSVLLLLPDWHWSPDAIGEMVWKTISSFIDFHRDRCSAYCRGLYIEFKLRY